MHTSPASRVLRQWTAKCEHLPLSRHSHRNTVNGASGLSLVQATTVLHIIHTAAQQIVAIELLTTSFTNTFNVFHHIRFCAAHGSIYSIAALLLKSEPLTDLSLFLLHHICGAGYAFVRIEFKRRWNRVRNRNHVRGVGRTFP